MSQFVIVLAARRVEKLLARGRDWGREVGARGYHWVKRATDAARAQAEKFADKDGALAPAVADFSPGLLAIQEAPPARLPRTVLRVTLVLFGVLFVWSLWGTLDIIASAEGRLVPQTYVKIVQPADAGIVKDILVREGQEVQAGQVLMRLDPRLTEMDLSTLQSDTALKALTLRRIDAELSGQPLLMRSGDPPALFAQVQAQYRARRQAYLDAEAQEMAVLTKARADLAASQQTLTKLRETLPVYRKISDSFGKLSQEGFVSPLAAQDKERERIEREQDLKAQESVVQSMQASVAQSEKRLAQIRSNYESQLHNERVETDGAHTKVTGELNKLQHKAGLLELKAPQAGVIKDLATHTVGTVVQPGTIMMNLVPRHEPLQAEVAVKNEEVGFVRPGQEVMVKLATYPFQKYGMLQGRIDHVSADTISADNAQRQGAGADGQGMSYKAIVALYTQEFIGPDGRGLDMAPGMQVTAEIHLGRRTVIEYLLSPMKKVGQEAARER